MIDTEKNILAIDFLYLYKTKKYCGQKKKKDKKKKQKQKTTELTNVDCSPNRRYRTQSTNNLMHNLHIHVSILSTCPYNDAIVDEIELVRPLFKNLEKYDTCYIS